MSSPEAIAKQFCQVYYEKYKGAAGERGTDLASLYVSFKYLTSINFSHYHSVELKIARLSLP